ncbi:uncharacterized protein si:dkeyp-51f12.3 isoform X2 [Puntigrus tetrazona]|uniref:uncharacterized protein si:dkeyp-51f12.3 isoform X1 n=1 Tax=Puntigrus tetrazona TaxID=1606681 RepID=UPI001C8A8653|nr:uncharacterized protein si:dkeyp-51f12.3 isoform X1 [Puntigrus tetrazona]XP_043075983.1 uncharacterized protein si:dkeyp-51f12.3 isoform X2 [Puntigrus tetrazona]
MCGVTRAENSVSASDGVARRNNMSCQNRCQVWLGILLVIAGLVLFMTVDIYIVFISTPIVCLGLFLLIRASCMVIKSSHDVAVPGHFLLHPRTGTRYTHHQAIAVQRRLDRIRRATAEEHSPVQVPPISDISPQIPPSTPPPWQMEPPPSYCNMRLDRVRRSTAEEHSRSKFLPSQTSVHRSLLQPLHPGKWSHRRPTKLL